MHASLFVYKNYMFAVEITHQIEILYARKTCVNFTNKQTIFSIEMYENIVMFLVVKNFFTTSCTNCIICFFYRNAIPSIILGRKTISKKGNAASTSTPLPLAIHLKRKGKELLLTCLD